MITNYADLVGEVCTVWSPRPKEWLPFTAQDKSTQNDKGIRVDVKVTGNYRSFITCTVLPHKNPKGFLNSSPYNITIDKNDIENRIIIVNKKCEY